jgi:hypothetical protein
MKSIALVLALLAALPARAESTIHLVAGDEELTHARQEQVRGRNLIIAAAVMQGVGLGLAGISGTGVFGNREGLIAVDGVAAILGFTSFALIPAGIVYWVRGARHERLSLTGAAIAPERAARYERAGTVMLFVAGGLGLVSFASGMLALVNVPGSWELSSATFAGGGLLTAIGAPLAVAGHHHAHVTVQLGLGSVRGTF